MKKLPLVPFLAVLCTLGFAPRAQAIQIALPSPIFSWGSFGAGLGISNITVQQYVAPDGSVTGTPDHYNVPVYARDTGPHDSDPTVPCNSGQRCEQIGNLIFDYALWRGSTAGPVGTVNRVGAGLFGGFQLLDSADLGPNYSFLQIYTDSFAPSGTIDGGGFAGKVDSQIPRYGTGWNFGGNAVQYDFFDVPYDIPGFDPPELVSFETALVNYDPVSAVVDILADFTWSFSTLGTPAPHNTLTGSTIAGQPNVSPALLGLYSDNFTFASYRDEIANLNQTVPEPPSLAMLATALIGLVLVRRRRPRAK